MSDLKASHNTRSVHCVSLLPQVPSIVTVMYMEEFGWLLLAMAGVSSGDTGSSTVFPAREPKDNN